MKTPVCLLLGGVVAATLQAGSLDRPHLPYTFEQNQGQAPAAVKYLAHGQGYGLFLTDKEAYLTLSRGPNRGQVVRMSLEGGRAAQAIEGLDRSTETANYFIGSDRGQWRTNIPNFERVRYRGVYEGVDLVYHSANGQLEYDFVVAPHVSADVIKVRFDGMKQLAVTPAGALELRFENGRLVHQAPVAYQEIGGRRQRVSASYQLMGEKSVGFRLGPHNAALPVVIDPVVIYSTFLGGDHTDEAHAVAVDHEGNVYVTGETTSTNFPVVGGGITRSSSSVSMAFVTKFDAAGTKIQYSAYLGGSSNTRGYAIAVDRDGNAYLGGVTGAKDFPLVDAVQTAQPGLNIAYIAKLNQTGTALVFSTLFGGERNDEVRDIAVGPEGNIHVVGRVTSTQFPVLNAIQSSFGGSSDAFVAMFKAPGYRLGYSTFLGSTSAEEGNAIALDAAGNTYVTGFAQGAGLATPGAYQTKIISPNDAFVAKINQAGNQVEWLTYYGGRGDDKGNTIALDAAGNVLVGGTTSSDNLPVTPSAVQGALRGTTDAFLARFDGAGKQLLYGTYLGSSGRNGIWETISRIAVDPLGAVTVAGVVNSADFPMVRPLQQYGGGNSDGFVARFNPELTALQFSTPIGGSNDDTLQSMVMDETGGIHIAGDTLSSNFPLKNALISSFAGSQDAFVAHICDPSLVPSAGTMRFTYEIGKTAPAAQDLRISACAPIPYTVTLDGDFVSATPLNGVTNGTAAVSVKPQNLQPGDYHAKLHIAAPDAVNSPITVDVILTVTNPRPRTSAAGIVHGATALGGPVAPGEIAVIYGDDLGPKGLAQAGLDSDGRVSNNLQGTRVYFDGAPAPMIYTSAGQIAVVVPYSVAGKANTAVEVEYLGQRSESVTVPVAQTAPGIFTLNATGTGPGAILNQDYGVNGAGNPAPRGSVVLVYATGEGQTSPAGSDGALAGNVLAKPVAPISVTIGGVPAEVMYAGAAPGLVSGMLQINVVVPTSLPAGVAEIQFKAGNAVSRPGVTLAVK